MIRKKLNRNGITLVELVVTLAILSIIIQVAYSIFFVGNKSFATSKDIGFAQQELRNTSMALGNRIRMAKEISINDFLEASSIEIQDVIDNGVSYSNILIDGVTFGPFLETSFTVNNGEQTLNLPLYSTEYSTVGEVLTVRLENWKSFIGLTQFVDPITSLQIEFKTFYYSTY